MLEHTLLPIHHTGNVFLHVLTTLEKSNICHTFGKNKQTKSKKYLTIKEAMDAERNFLVTSTTKLKIII